jgi:hypothetical protein
MAHTLWSAYDFSRHQVAQNFDMSNRQVSRGFVFLPPHSQFGERPRWLDRDRDLERPARRDELRRPSHGSPGPEILICGMGAGGVPVVLSRARRHFSTGMRRSPCGRGVC